MGLLNEIRLWNQIRLVNLYTFEIDENVKRDKTVEFVTWLNIWNCWMRWECKTRKNSWICDTVECVGLLNEIRLWNQIRLVNLYTFEIDENVKRDKTVEFVTWLNIWNCWMRWECKTRKNSWICDTVECVGLLNEMRMWN